MTVRTYDISDFFVENDIDVRVPRRFEIQVQMNPGKVVQARPRVQDLKLATYRPPRAPLVPPSSLRWLVKGA